MKKDLLTQTGYTILQDQSQFCFGIDAVLLANFAAKEIRTNAKIIDLCSGNGIIPLLLCGTTKAKQIDAVEIQEEAVLLAKESVKINSLEEKITITCGNIKNVQTLFEKYSYDTVTCNPPYAKATHGKESPVNAKAIARHEILCNLEDVIKSAEYLLKPNGRFFLIHRPERLSEIFSFLNKYKMEPSVLRFIQPFADTEPTMVLIEARKNLKPNVKVLPPLIIYREKGIYSEEVNEMYKKKPDSIE